MGGGPPRAAGAEVPQNDTGEQIYISSLSLLKMLKHAKAGVPFEVMGLMVGEIHDDYSITVVDVFSMPQTGSTVSVEAVDPEYQLQFMDMMKQVGQEKNCVGWYHSHPGFGPWLSGTDIETQKSQEQLNGRSVAVVVDPIQSVKGKVVMDAFRNIDQQIAMMGIEPRQTTSNIGFLNRPSRVAIEHGLNRYYYSIVINCRKNEFEQKMLLNLNKENWSGSLRLKQYTEQHDTNLEQLQKMSKLTEEYNKWIKEETKMTREEFMVKSVGMKNPKKALESEIEENLNTNVMDCLGSMVNTVVF
jgi:26S proteasome regulatory subunit N11